MKTSTTRALACLATAVAWWAAALPSPLVAALDDDEATATTKTTKKIRGLQDDVDFDLDAGERGGRPGIAGMPDGDGRPTGGTGGGGGGTSNQQTPEDLVGENDKPFQIGGHHKIRISSNERFSEIKPQRIKSPAGAKGPNMQSYTLSHPGATYIAAHFAEMDIPTTCTIEISNPIQSDLDKVIYTGKGRHNMGDFWARSVMGDTLLITMECMGDSDKYAKFEIDDYVAGFPNEATDEGRRRILDAYYEDHGTSPAGDDLDVDDHPFVQFHHDRRMSICGSDDKENAICYQGTTEYERARAVARLKINGSGACTGWLVSENPSLLLTNQHCIENESDALNTEYEFMGEETSCGSTSGDCWWCMRGDIYNAARLLKSSVGKDYALIELEGDPAAQYGYLELDNRAANIDEQIYIVQHPSGHAKEMGYKDTNEAGGVCRVLNRKSPCKGWGYLDVGYSCDTQGGSSGSPVLARSSHKVIALHHCGGACNGNYGVPIDQIYGEIEQYIGPAPTPTSCPGGQVLEVFLKTDRYPGETTWYVRKAYGGETVESSLNHTLYTAQLIDHTTPICLEEGDYVFEITDTATDGICCGTYGDGRYELTKDGTRIPTASTGDFGSSEATSFSVDGGGVDTTASPTTFPTKSPTKSPTSFPTKSPTSFPTKSPTAKPTISKSPTPSPTTSSPTRSPTSAPTLSPTTTSPTGSPTPSPTRSPTKSLAITGQGYLLSNDPNGQAKNNYNSASDALYMVIWSDRVDHTDLRKAEYEVKIDGVRYKSKLYLQDDTSFRAVLNLKDVEERGSGKVKLKLEDEIRRKYEVKDIPITIY